MKTIWNNLQEGLINTLNALGLAWWVKIITQNPQCTYYFGPFLSFKAANKASIGYIEDLEIEGAQGIIVNVERCKPSVLTIAEDLGEWIDRKVKPVFSGQI